MTAVYGGKTRPLGLEGIEVIMFRTVGDQPPLWSPCFRRRCCDCRMSWLGVDVLPDDPAFFARSRRDAAETLQALRVIGRAT
jgi:hypothetical protein